jgi:hypothetical protein
MKERSKGKKSYLEEKRLILKKRSKICKLCALIKVRIVKSS